MNAKTITLEKPVTLFGSPITEVRINEPTGLLYLQLGDPRMPVSMGEAAGTGSSSQRSSRTISIGCSTTVTDDPRITAASLLALLSFTDVRAIKAAFFDFFRPAAATPTE